jgi:acetyltransferase-like isoleucine patch superfamily enzyme
MFLNAKVYKNLIYKYINKIILAHVGRSVTLTSGCVIGAKCSLITNETLPENTVIFGSDHQRRTMPDRPAV